MILVTPFNADNKQCTGPSVNSGFQSIDNVVAAMGDGHVIRRNRLVVYGDAVNRVVFSDNIVFHVDGVDNKDYDQSL